MPLPTDRQRNDFYLALARLTTSCQEANKEGAIAACEDLIHDARGILAQATPSMRRAPLGS